MRRYLGRLKRWVPLAREPYFELLEWLARYHEGLGARRSYERKRPEGPNGEFLPWMTYPAIAYFKQLDLSQATVFEFGSGHGSIFWAERAASVTSVEDDAAWIEELRGARRPNQKILFAASRDEYVQAIHACERPPDVVVVDGSHRRACAEAAVKAVSPSGIIIVDNSDWCPQACAVVADAGFEQLDFIGPGPINAYPWATSVFVRRGSGSGLPRKQRAPIVGGGLTQSEDGA